MNFDSYEQARDYSLTVPWKTGMCADGESCWCRTILPIENIEYTDTADNFGRILEAKLNIDCIVPDGAIDKPTAEYIVILHNEEVRKKERSKAYLKWIENQGIANQEVERIAKSLGQLGEDIPHCLNKIKEELGRREQDDNTPE